MTKIFLLTSLIISMTSSLFAQKYLTRTGKIHFNATAQKSPEKIEAINNEVANVFDVASGDIVFQVLVKNFKFERELMKEHFNENYMESDKYPKAEFRGSISNLKEVSFSKEGKYNVNVSGKMSIHGTTQVVTAKGIIDVKGEKIRINARFEIKLKDYNISIPSLVADKVAQIATITLETELLQK